MTDDRTRADIAAAELETSSSPEFLAGGHTFSAPIVNAMRAASEARRRLKDCLGPRYPLLILSRCGGPADALGR